MNDDDLDNIRKTILDLKEKRWQFQQKLMQKYDKHIISFRFNIPSWPKKSKSIKIAFHIIINEFEDYLKSLQIIFQKEKSNIKGLGPECFYLFDGEAEGIKNKTIEFEKHHPIGRLLDIDVLTKKGYPIEREIKRMCFICNDDLAINCMRKASHSPIEARKIFNEKIVDYLKKKKFEEEKKRM